MRTKNKKAWIRILEAFVAILLIFSVILIILSKQRNSYDNNEELLLMQQKILDYAKTDEIIRTEVLNNNTFTLNKTIEALISPSVHYYTRICAYDDICGLGFYVDGEIYSSETLIVANRTSYGAPVKLKIYFWRE